MSVREGSGGVVPREDNGMLEESLAKNRSEHHLRPKTITFQHL